MGSNTCTVQGEVLHITARNADTLWSVMTIRPTEPTSQLPNPVTIVGYTAAAVGQIVTASGKIVDSRYGKQLKASSLTAENPVTAEGIERYLGSGLVEGIGPALAKRIVKAFGSETLKIITDDPQRLSEIKGIGANRSASISEEWRSQDAQREIMLFFHSQGISGAMARRIHKCYGDQAIDVVRENPYRLCSEVRGIGFNLADGIARSLGIPPGSPARVEAGLAYVMETVTMEGSTGIDEEAFIAKSSEMLNVPQSAIREGLEKIVADETSSSLLPLIRFGSEIYAADFVRHEGLIASRILDRAKVIPVFSKDFSPSIIEDVVKSASSKQSITPSATQVKAIESVFAHGVSIITGGPGCGKTTTLSVLIRVLDKMRLNYSFAAPTGKAAQRISETTGCEALTIHRLLELRPDTSEARRVDEDVLIVDEGSMIDVQLMSVLVRNLSKNTVLVLVGDADQLPSVGPGRVMRDLIESRLINTTRLNTVFRQGAGSQIKIAAQEVQQGHYPSVSGQDFFILHEGNTRSIADALAIPNEELRAGAAAAACADIIVDLVQSRIPNHYGFNWHDIQVLSPMNKGDVGVQNLNYRLQKALNESGSSGRPYRLPYGSGGKTIDLTPGDRVIQTVNDYNLDIFNGDSGYIESIDHKAKKICVNFGRGVVGIAFGTVKLKPAYAITIHKSQGSESPVVIVPMVTQHWNMLQRDLLYTALTRARKLAIIVGQKRAIAVAAKRVGGNSRTTRLLALLSQHGA